MTRRVEGTRALILGGGGIATAVVSRLAAVGVTSTVVRHRPDPVPGAVATTSTEHLAELLPDAEWVVVAWALTPTTEGLIDSSFLARMRPDAWLINIARGRHVVTDDLVEALRDERIAGAALDVTDPEPLPAGHPLWAMDNVIITPHSANTLELLWPDLARRVGENLARDRAGEPLLGQIDSDQGY